MTLPRAGSRLFGIYVVASLVPLIILWAVLNVTVRHQIDARALAEGLGRARTIADASIEPALAGHDLTSGITPVERADLIRAVSALRDDAVVIRLRIRAPGGTIVFDELHPDAPPIANHDDDVIRAASGFPVGRLTRLNEDQVDRASRLGVRAVEAYVPLNAVGKPDTIGVLESYLPYAPFGDAAASSKRHLTWLLTAGLVALWGVLALVTWSITRRLRRLAQDNDWLARHDRLTRLPNRVAFGEQLAAAWERDGAIIVAVLDVARFREVNDTLGHANGDAYLCHVATALSRELGQHHAVARLGGDEFGVMACGSNANQTLLNAGIRAAGGRNFELTGIKLVAEFNVGLASRAQASDAVGLLRAAELALHAAKEQRVGCLAYTSELDQFDPERLALAVELRNALDNDELILHYQPQINLATGHVHSAEALLRWHHPRRGLLLPSHFVPIAETTSLIGPLTAYVLESAARQLSIWQQFPEPVTVSVNVSPVSLGDETFPEQLWRTLTSHHVSPRLLQVEITETTIVADADRAAVLLRQLHELGVRVSLDDFGQGATSLISLSHLTLDELKIDRSFVASMASDDGQRMIVQSVIDLGHRLGLSVVAEGIETEEAAALLTSMGCDVGQGFFYSRAVSAEAFETWLRQRTSTLA